MDTDKLISELEEAIQYRFKDKTILLSAITHRSYIPESGKVLVDNERLEFLGDAVLELIVSDLLFKRFADKYREGDLTKMRAYLVSEARLVKLAKALGLGEKILMGRGEEKCGGRSKPSILADAFEAVTGAIYLDGGFNAAYKFVKGQFGDLLEGVPERGLLNDYKSRLQEMIQRYFHALPSYRLIEATGPDHQRLFRVALYFNEKELSQGTGRTKKEAEQQAARAALENLKESIIKDGFG